MNRRHHCRTCHRSVCHTCSPSTVSLQGHNGLQRACTPCVTFSVNAPEFNKDLAEFGQRLHSMSGIKVAVSSTFHSLGDTIEFCKAALDPLEGKIIELQQKQKAADRGLREAESKLR